jgi:hypothetical protein
MDLSQCVLSSSTVGEWASWEGGIGGVGSEGGGYGVPLCLDFPTIVVTQVGGNIRSHRQTVNNLATIRPTIQLIIAIKQGLFYSQCQFSLNFCTTFALLYYIVCIVVKVCVSVH